MTLLTCLIFLIAVVGSMFAAAAYIQVGKQDRMKILDSIAGRWNAKAVQGDLFTRPRLLLTIDGVDGEVTFRPGSEGTAGAWTRVHIGAWTSVHFNIGARSRLRVWADGFWSSLAARTGGSDLRLGDASFDSQFLIRASDRAVALQVLAPHIRQDLLALRENKHDVTLDMGPTGIVLIVNEFLGNENERDELVRFIDLAIRILVETRRIPGIDLAEVQPALGTCPVCGHEFRKEKTKCPACGTPHHEDCWKYSGGCAIFGCSGRTAS